MAMCCPYIHRCATTPAHYCPLLSLQSITARRPAIPTIHTIDITFPGTVRKYETIHVHATDRTNTFNKATSLAQTVPDAFPLSSSPFKIWRRSLTHSISAGSAEAVFASQISARNGGNSSWSEPKPLPTLFFVHVFHFRNVTGSRQVDATLSLRHPEGPGAPARKSEKSVALYTWA
jgi:hypothetical protein